jgi:hypothetical protein
MKKRTEDELTRLADAAFKQAAEEVIERAEQTGTPVILCVNGEVKAVDPGAVRKISNGPGGPAGRRGDELKPGIETGTSNSRRP